MCNRYSILFYCTFCRTLYYFYGKKIIASFICMPFCCQSYIWSLCFIFEFALCTKLPQSNLNRYRSTFSWKKDFHTYTVHKPNLSIYNFVKVSGHNLESSQIWGFCMDFLNKGKRGLVISGFPPFSFTLYSNWTAETVRGCVSLKK